MTDRVLTEETVNTTERLAMQHGSQPRILAKPCVELCVSHRLLQQRVTELEKASAMTLQILEATEKLREDEEE